MKKYYPYKSIVAACTLRKDFENQQGAVIDRKLDVALQVALLGGAE